MYRNRILLQLKKEFLDDIMDFIGITFDKKSFCNLIRFVDVDNDGNPIYVKNEFNDSKMLSFVTTEEEFNQYKKRREEVEYFNPFCKYKNALTLLLMCVPNVYLFYCKGDDSEGDDFISDIVDDDDVTSATQEEILKYINIRQYPARLDKNGQMAYRYEMELKRDNNDSAIFRSAHNNKCIAIIMLIEQLIGTIHDRVDNPNSILTKLNRDYNAIEAHLEDLMVKYDSERTRNRKEMGKNIDINDIDLSSGVETESEIDDIDYSPSVDEAINESGPEKVDIKDNCESSDITNLIGQIQMPAESYFDDVELF